MEIAHTSMTHARAPHFLWPYVVRYAAHQLNLWPHVSQLEVSPTSLWTGSPGAASHFCVWGCLALVHDTSADKISPRAVPCVFLGFPEDSFDYTFYHPPLHRFFDSRDVRFDESVPYYVRCSLLLRSPPPNLQQTLREPVFVARTLEVACSRGFGFGAESVPVRGPGSGGVRPLLDLESLGRTLLLLVVLALGVVRLVLWRVVMGLPPLRTLLLPPTPTRPGTRPVFAVLVRSSRSWSKRRESWSSNSWSYSGRRSSSSSSRSRSSRSSSRSRRSSSSSHRSWRSSGRSRGRSSSSSHLLLLSLVFGPSVSPLLLPHPLSSRLWSSASSS
ncbi:unnamed protein product [Closterium sp. NIES-54]